MAGVPFGLRKVARHNPAALAPQGRLKVAGKAALPPDLRKASGFPGQTVSLFGSPLGWKAEPSSRAEGVREGGGLEKAEPSRKSGGGAALGRYPSRTLTRPSLAPGKFNPAIELLWNFAFSYVLDSSEALRLLRIFCSEEMTYGTNRERHNPSITRL